MPPSLTRMPIQISALALVAGLAACSPAPDGVSIHDPYEAQNRRTYESSKVVDRAVLRPLGQAAATLPPALTDRVTSFADNTGLPGMVLNGLLQGDIGGAATNTMRFLINTTIGIGGIFDPAGGIGLYEESTDFGETLHVWGAPEGAYLVLPVLGPSTERDAVGLVVDFLINPLDRVGTPPQLDYALPAQVGEKIIDRGRFATTVDSILYDSADSYAQARILYLENRRFELGVVAGDAYVDPYADPYFDPYQDQ